VVILVVGILALGAWGVAGIVSITPTTDDVAAALEPEPYEEIEPVVISSIRDMASLTTVEAVEGCTVLPVTPSQDGSRKKEKVCAVRTHLQRESGDCRSGAVPGCGTLESRLLNRAGLPGKSMGKTKAAARPRKSDFFGVGSRR
jgi:hypothetical protein